MCVTVPLVPKSSSSWFAGARVPLPDTVDCTTPRATATVRSWALEVAGDPMTLTATTTAATVKSARTIVVTAGRREERLAIADQLAVVPEGAACGG
jgi:hypothetical protein